MAGGNRTGPGLARGAKKEAVAQFSGSFLNREAFGPGMRRHIGRIGYERQPQRLSRPANVSHVGGGFGSELMIKRGHKQPVARFVQKMQKGE